MLAFAGVVLHLLWLGFYAMGMTFEVDDSLVIECSLLFEWSFDVPMDRFRYIEIPLLIVRGMTWLTVIAVVFLAYKPLKGRYLSNIERKERIRQSFEIVDENHSTVLCSVCNREVTFDEDYRCVHCRWPV